LNIDLKNHFRRNEQVITQAAADAVFLFDLNRGEFYSLNDVGHRVWQLCDGSRSVDDLVYSICQEFEVPSETVEADVLELLADLIAEGLLESTEQIAQSSAAIA
jgi:pyrroloquinoline quinone biosynthesis protein D